ncbi:DNA polymerase Y family protein [Sphingomonas sp. IC-56]|uniref:Y-family DNA polymerase n=1 Tax=Sphingomonas sp. IC-56 TaxID=2898529 RepID=UPI001E54AAEE|nr:DNA polymerase Y family protein [Sphingomonas sp. IC-56]MCD2323244.1 DNA polymerase Y family protein [Sphingomonas sp. IC-56]
MQRVAAIFLPSWAIDRQRRAERRAQPEARAPAGLDAIGAAMAEEHSKGCSVPRGGGWRPGARWAREERQRHIDAMPEHQRPPIRDLGRCDVAAEHAFKRIKSDAWGHPKIPGTGRGTPSPADDVGPSAPRVSLAAIPLHHASHGPPPRSGEDLSAPLVTALRTANRQLVAAACPAAQALGITPGMALAQARAQVAGLDIRPADPQGDRADLERLAITLARRWTPSVAVEGEDTLFLDLTGVAHLHGGEARMARRLVRMLARLGVTAQVAVADTAGAAWAATHVPEDCNFRFGRDSVLVCPPGEHPALLAQLPTEALRLDASQIELLHRLGVNQIGQLLVMPRAPLVRRFGASIVLRLDQALGHIAEPLHPVIPPEPIAVTQRFAEPIASPEAIAHWLGELVPRLAAELAQAGQGARRVELVADRIDGVPQRIAIGLARPNRDPAHLLRLLLRRIEEVEPGYGIDAMTLHLRRGERLGPEPVTERLDAAAAPDIVSLVDTLATRIGERRMWRTRPVESDVPERSATRAPVLDPPERTAAALKAEDIRRLDRNATLHPWYPGWPKPARLLRRPERLDHVMAELPDQPPRRFTWRGQPHKVVRADGPERIFGEWWKRDAERHAVRDYFHVEDDAGHRYWLFRSGDGERPVTGDLSWYLHGVFG